MVLSSKATRNGHLDCAHLWGLAVPTLLTQINTKVVGGTDPASYK